MRQGSVNPDRIVYQVAFAAVAGWVFLAFLNWKNLVQGAQFGLPGALPFPHPLLFEGHVQWRPMAGVVLLNIAAAVIGHALVIRPIWGRHKLAGAVWLFFAGIPPGVLLLVTFSRCITLFLPNRIAPAVIMASVAAVAGAAIYLAVRQRRESIFNSINVRSCLVAAVSIAGVLIFEVQFDVFHVAGEAIVFFIDKLLLSTDAGFGASGHWPLVAQHYDEAAFLYPVVYGLVSPGDDARDTLVALYWIAVAWGRLGGMSITYLAVRGLGVDRLSAVVAVGFFMCASLSLNPLSTRLLFDSLNPLGYALHDARFWIAVLPVILISAATVARGRARWPALIVAIALGVGLSATPIHVLLVFLWAVAVLAATALFPAASREPRLWRAACLAGLIILAACSLSYGLSSAPILVRAAALVCGAAGAAIVVTWSFFDVRRAAPRPDLTDLINPAKVLIALCCGYLGGTLLLGNVLADKTLSALSWVWPWSHLTVFHRLAADVVFPSQGLQLSPYCVDGLPWLGRFVTGHCGSLPLFVRAYGLPVAAITFVFAWWLKRAQRINVLEAHQCTMMFWGIVLSLVALPIAFFQFDYISGTRDVTEGWLGQWLAIWLRSRLIEPWFYSGTILAFALFLTYGSQRERQILQSMLMVSVAVYILGPLVLPAQLVANFAYLLARVFGI
jgi:hypothetical protein